MKKLKSELTKVERGDVDDCTVCSEDQERVAIEGLPPFDVCRKFAEKIKTAAQNAKRAGFPIQSIIGYRVGMTKGGPDAQGLRTEFSNHSYGVAVDFNSESNGLYENCESFGPKCKLLRGGIYNVNAPTTITRSSVLFKEMQSAGFKWGGEIAGRQKDFMHFSPTGY